MTVGAIFVVCCRATGLHGGGILHCGQNSMQPMSSQLGHGGQTSMVVPSGVCRFSGFRPPSISPTDSMVSDELSTKMSQQQMVAITANVEHTKKIESIADLDEEGHSPSIFPPIHGKENLNKPTGLDSFRPFRCSPLTLRLSATYR